jgi:hypothetical protein
MFDCVSELICVICQRQRVDHRLAVNVETARQVMEARHADRIFGPGAGREPANRGSCSGRPL